MWFGEADPPPRPAGPGPAVGPRPPAVRTGNTRLKLTDLTQQVKTAEESKIQLPSHLSKKTRSFLNQESAGESLHSDVCSSVETSVGPDV